MVIMTSIFYDVIQYLKTAKKKAWRGSTVNFHVKKQNHLCLILGGEGEVGVWGSTVNVERI